MATEWIELAGAAEQLGLSRSAARKRCERGTLSCQRRSGRLFVAVATRRPERDDATAGSDETSQQQDAESTTTVAALRDEVAYLRQVIATRDEEIRRRDHLLAGLIERLPALPETTAADALVATNPPPGQATHVVVGEDASRPESSLVTRLLHWIRGFS